MDTNPLEFDNLSEINIMVQRDRLKILSQYNSGISEK